MIDLTKSDAELEKELEEAKKAGQKNQKKVFAFLCLVILAVCIPLLTLFAYFGYNNYQTYVAHNELAKSNSEAEGLLQNEYTEVTRKGIKTYRFSYTFKVDGQYYKGTAEISTKPSSSRIAIVYNPANPNINKIKDGKDEYEYSTIPFVATLIVGIIASIVLGAIQTQKTKSQPQPKTHRKSYSEPYPQKSPEKVDSNNKIKISSESILWIEKEILKLNQEITGEERPEHNFGFFQTLPKPLLEKDILTANDVAEAATQLVNQTRKIIGKLDVPFRKPRVEFTSKLPEDEPGHIEFGENETIIRIHPNYVDNPFALASILCHELAHFILDHNGLRKSNRNENEKLTDLFVFKCGQGLIYLQGILDVTSENGRTIESRLGYLTLEEMAYSHVRCSSQYGLQNSKIAPNYYSGKTFGEVIKAIDFLTIKKSLTKQLAEIIVCPNNHVLRISTEKKSQSIRCPKCKWETVVWLHKNDHLDFLIKNGVECFDSGKFNEALENFRDAQAVSKTYSMAYCWASRCLKRLGKRQDAIRELQKILATCPEDITAQNEMKSLIYP